jgi:hypothetical protein
MRINKTFKVINDSSIIKIVCDTLAVDFNTLIERNATRPFPDYRTILTYCLKEYGPPFGASVRIGRILKRDHASILYLFKKSTNLIETDPEFRTKLNECIFKLEKLKTDKMQKTTIELLNEMQKAQVITEAFKLTILRAIELEKNEAIQAILKQNNLNQPK